MKIIEGDLVMDKDMHFKEDIRVTGHIIGKDEKRFNLRVEGDIDARNINAGDIVCVSRKKKHDNAKTIAYSLITDRFNRIKKEQILEKKPATEEGKA